MQQFEIEPIRPYLELAVDDLNYYLTALDEQEKARTEFDELYNSMLAGETASKGKKAQRLTKTQYNALVNGTSANGNPITDEKREAILAKLGPGEPINEAGYEALAFWRRGGWRESARQAAGWLRKAGEIVVADAIDVELVRLPEQPRDASEQSDYRDAMRTAAERVKSNLTRCIAKGSDVRADIPKFIYATNHQRQDYRDLAVELNRANANLKDERSENNIAIDFFKNWTCPKALKALGAIRKFERDQKKKIASAN